MTTEIYGGRDLNDIFGGRKWRDVYSSILRATVKRWPMMKHEDVEDAVQGAMVDLVDYWIQLPSSVSDDTQRNFAYAVTRGTWKANSFLGKMLQENNSQISLEELEVLENSSENFITELANEPFGDWPSERAPEWYSPSAEDVMFDNEMHDVISNAINSLSENDFEEWFDDFWSGESLVEIAERRNVSPDTIRMRRNRGLTRLAEQTK
jgi:RNA polymerase sigma factor (sigma-70 family)